tara:strand:+ start:852 stop:1328 length:477 start_codon:yes stop_codon:yes gene_type:complete
MISIRKVTKKNFRDFKHLYTEGRRSFVRFRDEEDNWTLKPERFLEGDKYFAYVLYKDGRVIAYLANVLDFKKKGVAKLHAGEVKKKFRGRGYGIKINRFVIKKMKEKGYKKIVVRTWSSNQASQGMFKKLGFEKYRTIKNNRVNGDDSVWWRMRIGKD